MFAETRDVIACLMVALGLFLDIASLVLTLILHRKEGSPSGIPGLALMLYLPSGVIMSQNLLFPYHIFALACLGVHLMFQMVIPNLDRLYLKIRFGTWGNI